MNDGDLPVRRAMMGFVILAFVFLVLDAAWLTIMADQLYRPALGALMRADFDFWAAAAFYVIYLCGTLFFAVAPARRARGAFGRGAFFGFVTYAAYDLTNQATLVGWPWHVTLIDLCWGPTVTSVSAVLAWQLAYRRSLASPTNA
ncbi:MAG: DUF2177 family protein [Burkholderiaceae bacterium]